MNNYVLPRGFPLFQGYVLWLKFRAFILKLSWGICMIITIIFMHDFMHIIEILVDVITVPFPLPPIPIILLVWLYLIKRSFLWDNLKIICFRKNLNLSFKAEHCRMNFRTSSSDFKQKINFPNVGAIAFFVNRTWDIFGMVNLALQSWFSLLLYVQVKLSNLTLYCSI